MLSAAQFIPVGLVAPANSASELPLLIANLTLLAIFLTNYLTLVLLAMFNKHNQASQAFREYFIWLF